MPFLRISRLMRSVHILQFMVLVTPPAYANTRVEEFLAMRRLVGENRFNEAIERCKELIPRYPDCVSLYESLAEVSLYAGRLKDAQDYFIKRAEYGEELGLAYFGLGEVSFAKEDFRGALYSYSRAIDVGLNIPEVYKKLEYAYEKTDGIENAIQMFEGLCHRQPDNANYWYAAALAYWSHGEWGKVLECAEEACRRQPFEPKVREAKAICLAVMNPAADPKEVEMLVDLATRRGDIQSSLSLLGVMLQSLRARCENRHFNDMLTKFESTARTFGYLRLLAFALSERGNALYYTGSLRSAEAIYFDAYLQAQTVRDVNQMLSISIQRCSHLLAQGSYSCVAEQALNCLSSSKTINAVQRRIDALGLLSIAYGETGDSHQSLMYAIEASNVVRRTSSESFSRIFTAQVLAGAYLLDGKYDYAMRLIYPALTKSRKLGLHTGPILAGILGVVKALMEDLRGARSQFERQVRWSRELNFVHEELLGRLHVAELDFLEGRAAQAMKGVDGVLSCISGSELTTVRILAQRLKSAIAICTDDTGAALRSSMEAFNLVLGLGSSDAAVGIGISRHLSLKNDLEQIVSILCAQGRYKEALDYFNRFLVHRFQSRAALPGIPENEEAGVLESLAEVWKERRQTVETLADNDIGGNLRNLWYNPPSSGREGKDPENLGVRPQLESDEALLVYLVGEGKTHFFACRKDSVSYFPVSAKRIDLEKMMANVSVVFRQDGPRIPILNSQTAGFSSKGARGLYDLLVLPAEPFLTGCRKLVIVPDQPLDGLPFEILIRAGQEDKREEPLVALYEISYAIAPRSSESNQVGFGQQRNEIVILGDPTFGSRSGDTRLGDEISASTPDPRNELSGFPGIRKEVRQISEIIGGGCKVLVGTQASKSAIFSLSPTIRLLHIATHVDWRPNEPGNPVIRLSGSSVEDNRSGLSVEEIRRLPMAPEMVVLSGCNTARPWPGEGSESMCRAFIFAGAASVVGSLWGVDDGTTATFMEGFYRHLLKGETRASALRQAKLELIRAGRSDPFYWGPFVLIGSRGKIELSSSRADPDVPFSTIILTVTSLLLIGVLVRFRT